MPRWPCTGRSRIEHDTNITPLPHRSLRRRPDPIPPLSLPLKAENWGSHSEPHAASVTHIQNSEAIKAKDAFDGQRVRGVSDFIWREIRRRNWANKASCFLPSNYIEFIEPFLSISILFYTKVAFCDYILSRLVLNVTFLLLVCAWRFDAFAYLNVVFPSRKMARGREAYSTASATTTAGLQQEHVCLSKNMADCWWHNVFSKWRSISWGSLWTTPTFWLRSKHPEPKGQSGGRRRNKTGTRP